MRQRGTENRIAKCKEELYNEIEKDEGGVWLWNIFHLLHIVIVYRQR